MTTSEITTPIPNANRAAEIDCEIKRMYRNYDLAVRAKLPCFKRGGCKHPAPCHLTHVCADDPAHEAALAMAREAR